MLTKAKNYNSITIYMLIMFLFYKLSKLTICYLQKNY